MDKFNNPLVSILLPCYNAEKYLRESIDSILNQTYTNFELLLIDDGSSDKTSTILSQYRNDSRIKIIRNEKNRGLITVLNQGIELAKGKYIARMDADDISIPERLEKMIEFLEENEHYHLISTPSILIDLEGRDISFTLPKGTKPKVLKFISLFCTPVVHGGVIGRTEVFKDNHYELMYIHSEDFRLFSRLALQGMNIGNIKAPYYKHRINPESVSNKFESVQIDTHIRISKENMLEYFKEIPEPQIHAIMINRFSFNVNIKMLSKAFNYLEIFRNRFVKIEKCNEDEVNEINSFLIEQRIDIMLQSLKYSSKINKIFILMFMGIKIRYFTTKRGFAYIKQKLYSKFKKR